MSIGSSLAAMGSAEAEMDTMTTASVGMQMNAAKNNAISGAAQSVTSTMNKMTDAVKSTVQGH